MKKMIRFVRKRRLRTMVSGAVAMLAAVIPSTTVWASTIGGSSDLSKIKNPMVLLITSVLKPALALVGVIGLLYCITIGVRFARTEDPQERTKAKNCFKNSLIGFALIFGLILGLNIGVPLLIAWVNENAVGIS
ncbi:MAG: hypothetical protein IIU28_05785 [Lachnospiraceae bacterium]|nr:hypothetical protein [Lachnospiraceae bacterium]